MLFQMHGQNQRNVGRVAETLRFFIVMPAAVPQSLPPALPALSASRNSR